MAQNTRENEATFTINGQQYLVRAYRTVRTGVNYKQDLYAVEVENLADHPPRLFERREFAGRTTVEQITNEVATMAGALEVARAYASGTLKPGMLPLTAGVDVPGRGRL